MTTDKHNTEFFYRWPTVAEITGICRSNAHKLANEGKFPKPIKLGPRASAWVASEIHQWVQDRIDKSRDASGF